jgi:hypothetical protein
MHEWSPLALLKHKGGLYEPGSGEISLLMPECSVEGTLVWEDDCGDGALLVSSSVSSLRVDMRMVLR